MSGPAVFAHGPVSPRSGRLVAIVRRIVPLLSRAPAGPRHVARPHRHDSHGPRLGAGQAFTQEPLRRELSASRSREAGALGRAPAPEPPPGRLKRVVFGGGGGK